MWKQKSANNKYKMRRILKLEDAIGASVIDFATQLGVLGIYKFRSYFKLSLVRMLFCWHPFKGCQLFCSKG